MGNMSMMHGYMYGNPTSKLMKRHFCSRWGKTAPGTYLHGHVRKWDKFNIYVLFESSWTVIFLFDVTEIFAGVDYGSYDGIK